MAPGDVNGFLGLALDNLTQLVILSSLLIGVFQFPADLVLRRMLPGTALGVLVGDLVYTWLALRLVRRTGRDDVTAMPFGIDTPTLFAMVFGVLGPVKIATGDPVLAWKVGMATTLAAVAAGVALWGLHMGLTQGLLAAMVAHAAPAELRGTAFGVFNLAMGLAMLLASAIAGALWHYVGPAATFWCAAALAAASLVLTRLSPR